MWIWDAFWRLSFSREVSLNGPAPISIKDIAAYAEFMQINDLDSRHALLNGVQTMDRLWLENHAKANRQDDDIENEQNGNT